MTDNNSTSHPIPEDPCPQTWGEIFKKIIWKIFTRDIDADLGGGKEIRVNVIAWIIVISSLIIAVFIFEKIGFIDDIKDMVIKHNNQSEQKK